MYLRHVFRANIVDLVVITVRHDVLVCFTSCSKSLSYRGTLITNPTNLSHLPSCCSGSFRRCFFAIRNARKWAKWSLTWEKSNRKVLLALQPNTVNDFVHARPGQCHGQQLIPALANLSTTHSLQALWLPARWSITCQRYPCLPQQTEDIARSPPCQPLTPREERFRRELPVVWWL